MARVLIVEDDQSDRIILANLVARTSHEAYFAYGGKEALEIYLGGGIDIVVTESWFLRDYWTEVRTARPHRVCP